MDPTLATAGRQSPAPSDPRTPALFHAHRDDPLARFLGLLGLARELQRDATAMTLATVDGAGRPSARIVLLKDVDARGLTFFTNLGSRKGREAAARPEVALLFYWHALEVQVRFEGPAAQVEDAEADAYFATRPRGSQLGAWASEQSAPLAARALLEERLAEATRRFEGGEVPRPPGWSGFRVRPRAVEFWLAQESRLHHRELYLRDAPEAPWRATLLFP